MTEGLQFLTEGDWSRLTRHGIEAAFGPKQAIVQEGDRRRAIFMIQSGEARVVRRDLGEDLVLGRLSPGSVFGEMSCIDDQPISASVIAETPVDVLVVSWADVRRAFAESDALAARFYQSMAVNLSARLRATTMRIGDLLADFTPVETTISPRDAPALLHHLEGVYQTNTALLRTLQARAKPR